MATPLAEAALTLLRYCTATPTARARVQLPQHMFTFLLEGEKVVQFAGVRVTVHPSQLVLLGAGNCLMSEKVATPGGSYHSLLLLFDPALLRDFFSRHAAWLSWADAAPSAGPPLLLVEADEFLRAYVRSLDCLLPPAGGVVPYPLLQAKLEELLVYLALYQPGQLAALRHLGQVGSEELRVREAVTTQLASPGPVGGVAELAFLCHMSTSTFKRRFTQLYGSSPGRWLLHQRMELAARQLRPAGRPVGEVAAELGYEDLSSFIQAFKQVHGRTPKQYQLAG
jgi:AraC-like DNA-binding protein